MQDNKPEATFTPTRPEKTITVEITAREAHLIKELRKVQFGRVMIHKANGILVRVEPNESILISEEEGLKLEEM